MKITVNKAKIKKLASFAAKSANSDVCCHRVIFHGGRAWALNAQTLISCEYEGGDGASVQIDGAALLEVVNKEGAKKEIEINLSIFENYTDSLKNLTAIYSELTNAPPLAKIPRMLWALLQPRGAGEICNLLVTPEQIKAELYEKQEKRLDKKCKEISFKFCAGCELNELNELKKPILFSLSDRKNQFAITKRKDAVFSVFYLENKEQYYLSYESDAGTVYIFCPSFEQIRPKNNAYHFSEEIKAAYKSAIEQMEKQGEPEAAPSIDTQEQTAAGGALENTDNPEQEKKEMQEQEKKEIETTTEKQEPQTEQTTEQPEATGWTGRANYQERKEARAEYREQKAAELHRQAEKLRESIPTDYAYWTQPAHTYSAAGRAFERQRERERGKYDKIYKMEQRAEYLENHTESKAISSDDPEALEKLKAKIEELTKEQNEMKEANKKARKEGKEAPYPSYHLQNNNQNINRLKKRVEELQRRQGTTWKEYEFDGGRVVPNVSENRYQIFHDEKPEQSIIDFMKSHGWRWSKFNKCWQRLLNRETVRVIESSGKWGYTDYLPNLRVDGADEPQEPEQAAEPEPIAEPTGPEQMETQSEQKPVKTVEERQLENVDNIAAELMKKLATLTIYSKEAGTFGDSKEGTDYIFATFDSVQDASKYACENIVESNSKKTALQIAYMTPEKWEIVSNPGGRWGTWIKVKYKAFYEQFNGEYAGDVFVKFEVWNIDNWGAGKKYYSSYTIIKDGAESWKFEKDTLSFPVEIVNPQPEKEQIEMKAEKQTETKHEPELPATFPPAAVRLDPLELWGEPLDYSRVQVIKHNAQECGLALMVYNVKGDGALFAMLASFWAIVKERSQFDETAQRFIEDNFESVICFFDKEPEGGEIEPEPGDLARNWMQDAAEVKREPVSIPVPVPVPAPVVACKVAAPVSVPEPEPKAEKPTWTELKYALSLLAMNCSIDDLINKFVKKTSKPVRKSVVEKLLFEIDRGSVPKPGESKREYIKAYYQTH